MNLHPLVVHAPIMLLLLYPITILCSIFWKKYEKEWMFLSFVLLVGGFFSVLLSIGTGEQLEDWVEWIAPSIVPVFKRHEEFAEMTRNLVLLALITHVLGYFFKKIPVLLLRGVHVVLAIGIAALVTLTGAEGGRLTHEYHVGAVHCQEIAHPLTGIAEALMPLQVTEEQWQKRKGGNEAALSTRMRFEQICKSAVTQSGSTLKK